MIDPGYPAPFKTFRTLEGQKPKSTKERGSKDPRLDGYIPPPEHNRPATASGISTIASIDTGDGVIVVVPNNNDGMVSTEQPLTYQTFVANFRKLLGRDPKPEEIWEAAQHNTPK